MKTGPKSKPVDERFWSFVKEPFDPINDCWNWQGHVNVRHGYGQFTLSRNKKLRAHRFAYEFFNGPIPEGLEVHHNCDNRKCVNPTHLELLSAREHTTTKRLFDLGALSRVKTHCPQGHLYDEENTGLTPSGGRYCKACKREKIRLYRAKTSRQSEKKS
jgi:hypothetical protein